MVALIPILKIIALGSIKLIFLLLGFAFFPVFALRFILGGATGMLMPTLDWLQENNKIDTDRHRAIMDDLSTLNTITFSRSEARLLLRKLIIKMFNNAVASCQRFSRKIAGFFKR